MPPSQGASIEDGSRLSSDESTTEAKANVKSSRALASAKQNITYLFSPNNPNSPHPARLRTRGLLKALHYLGVFIFWRVVRYAKYAVVGSVVAAVGATAFGGFVSGIGWVLAPPGILGTVAVGTAWAIGKWGFRKLGVKERTAVEVQRQAKKDERGVRVDGQWRDVQGPRAVPW